MEIELQNMENKIDELKNLTLKLNTLVKYNSFSCVISFFIDRK